MPRVNTHEPFPTGVLSYSPVQVCYTYSCTVCGLNFEANSGNAKRCPPCRKKHDSEQRRIRDANRYRSRKK